MKKIIPLVIIFFLVVSNLFAQAREELNYYPLHVGDVWQYKVTRKSYGLSEPDQVWYGDKMVLSDTLMQNGKHYFAIKNNMSSTISNPSFRQYFRIDTVKGLLLQYMYGLQDMFIDSLYSQKGDTYRGLYCKDVNVKNILGTTRVSKFIKYNLISSEFYFEYELALGLGEVYRRHDDNFVYTIRYTYDLIYAKINGKEYGTFVGVNEQEIIPSKYSLSQNYPNPFNPTTKIKFSIPAVETRRGESLQYVTLKVFDILGNEIATLVNEEKLPGDYEITFNGINLTSGVYFYRLTTKDFSLYKKMILIK